MEEELLPVSKPGIEYISHGETDDTSGQWKAVQAILEHPDCQAVSQVWFSVGEHFGYNGFVRGGHYHINRDYKDPHMPGIPNEASDDELVVLVTSVEIVRKIAGAINPVTLI